MSIYYDELIASLEVDKEQKERPEPKIKILLPPI